MPVSGTALLLIDVIHDLAFDGSEALIAQSSRARSAAAYMRELKIFAPADCIVSNATADNHHALRQINTVLKGHIAESTRLKFRRS